LAHRQPLIAGNWKLNGSRTSVVNLATEIAAGCGALSAEVLVCPTSVHVSDVLGVVGNSAVHLGAQNCSDAETGAFTGEVSASMLSEFGCEYVILGHSERRAMYHETSDLVAAEQLDAVLSAAGVDAFRDMVVAYEPVWAIGTGKTASPEQAQEVHAVIRGRIASLNESIASKLRILYGGSVKPDNAATLFAQADIDGGLIGGAALDAESFLAICEAAA